MVKKIIIKQSCGIVDILFSLRIARIVHNKYKAHIIWPILPSIFWIKD